MINPSCGDDVFHYIRILAIKGMSFHSLARMTSLGLEKPRGLNHGVAQDTLIKSQFQDFPPIYVNAHI